MILANQGKMVLIETKIHPRKPTGDQLAMHEILRKKGFDVAVIYDLKEFIKFIKEVGIYE